MFSSNLKLVVLSVFVSVSFFVTGCKTASVMTTTASDAISLKSEPMKIWTRPLETGFTVMGKGEGEATSDKSEKAIDNAPAFFLTGSVPENSLTPVVKLAAYNAILDAKADGMYITMVKEEESAESVKTAWVKGIMLKLVFYDTVSSERSDEARLCEKGCKGNCCFLNGCKKSSDGETK